MKREVKQEETEMAGAELDAADDERLGAVAAPKDEGDAPPISPVLARRRRPYPVDPRWRSWFCLLQAPFPVFVGQDRAMGSRTAKVFLFLLRPPPQLSANGAAPAAVDIDTLRCTWGWMRGVVMQMAMQMLQ